MILDPRLLSSSSFIHDLKLCQVRLSHNAAFPWILLIPNQSKAFEIIDLSAAEQMVLMQEITFATHIMKRTFQPDKLNVASLGNIVPQLHIHIIARFKNDDAWPNPVWNSGIEKGYSEQEKNDTINLLRESFIKLNNEY